MSQSPPARRRRVRSTSPNLSPIPFNLDDFENRLYERSPVGEPMFMDFPSIVMTQPTVSIDQYLNMYNNDDDVSISPTPPPSQITYLPEIDVPLKSPIDVSVTKDVELPATCFDPILLNEEDIREYLKDKNNMVIFVKRKGGYIAECSSFQQIRNLMMDPSSVFYECTTPPIPFNEYAFREDLTRYVKLPLSSGSLLVDYYELLSVYLNLENKIFLKYQKELPKTVSHNVSVTMDAISGYHCQEGTNQKVYKVFNF
jgi:hypothetical protein